MSDVDGLLERLKRISSAESCKRYVGRAMNATDVRDIIDAIEQQRAEIERLIGELAERCELRCPSCKSDDVDDSYPEEYVCLSCDFRMEPDQAAGIKAC